MSAAGKFGRGVLATCVRLVFMAAAVLCCGVTVFALDPSLDISQYAHTAWRIREGFPNAVITSFAQTPDGYLWLGTELGLLRFDGVRAVAWQPPRGQELPSNNIQSLLAAPDGTLWIGTMKGLASWKDGKLTQYAQLAGRVVGTVLEDREGTIWASGLGVPTGRLCQIRTNEIKCYGDDGSFGKAVMSLFEDSKGTLWAGTANGLWRWRPDRPRFFPLPGEPNGIRGLGEDIDGTLLVGWKGGIRRFVDGETKAYPLSDIVQPFTAVLLLRDRDGGLWIERQGRGIMHVHRGRTDSFSLPDGLSGEDAYALFEDREGSIWIGTRDGLDRFRDFTVHTISVKQGLSSTDVGSVLADGDGSVWLTDGRVQRWRDREISTYAPGNGKLNGRGPHSLFRDDRGRIWVCTRDGVGYLEDGRFIRIAGIPGGFVHAIAQDTSGNLWIASQDAGLFHLVDTRVTEQIPWAKLGHKDHATALAADPQGGLWVGFYNGGIAHFRDGQVRVSYATADGLSEGWVTDLRVDHDGTVWVATEGGLSQLKNGRIATLNSKNGLPCDGVHWVIEDDDRSFWLYMPCGLARIARLELDAWAAAAEKNKDTMEKIQITVFDSSDGVKRRGGPVGYAGSVAKAPDGKLWFTPFDGVSVFDPRHLPVNTLPPPVHVEQITADRKTYDATSDRRRRLPPQVRDVQIDYTALSLVAPEKMLFRYKLEGRDRDWQNVGNRRQAFYTDLPPGNYRFRVAASNNSGVWNEAGAFLDFSVAPAYYQTTWFRLSLVAAFLGLLWALYQLRLHQLDREFNAGLEGQLSERMRVARELHDTLLQSFQGLLLMFQTVLYALPERPVEAKQKLETAVDQAAQAITDGRDAVHALRSSTVIAYDLAQSIAAIGQGLATREDGAESAAFRIQVEGTPRSIHPHIRDEVYRIAGEALRNAFNHARARQIEVGIDYRERQLRLRIRDDGKGLDPNIQPATGHFGLRGMQERAQVLGGRLDVWSEVGTGTEVDLTIPASVAYAKVPNSRRFWFSRRAAASRS